MDEDRRKEYRREEATDWLISHKDDLASLVRERERILKVVGASERTAWFWSKTGWLKDTLLLLGLIAALLKDSILSWITSGPKP